MSEEAPDEKSTSVEAGSDASEATPQSSSDYEVGYRRPPLEHQFRKGRSGNPKGRPKGAKGLKQTLEQVLDEKTPAKIKGRMRHITKGEAAVRVLVDKMLRGDMRALEFAIKKLDAGAQEEFVSGASEARTAQLDADDEATIAAFLDSLPADKRSEP